MFRSECSGLPKDIDEFMEKYMNRWETLDSFMADNKQQPTFQTGSTDEFKQQFIKDYGKLFTEVDCWNAYIHNANS